MAVLSTGLMATKLGRGVSFELANAECDVAAVPGDTVSSSYKSEGQSPQEAG